MDGLTVLVDERGSGRPLLMLHGAGGPPGVASFAGAMAGQMHVLAPTHPGFAGEPRLEWFKEVDDLALTWLDLLERLDLRDVIVISFSSGGWIAAELAARNASCLGGLILVDAAAIQVEGHEIPNVFSRAPGGSPVGSNQPPVASGNPGQDATRAAKRQTFAAYTREQSLRDPKLRRRLARVEIPALVVWEEEDNILAPDYGRAYAQALPNARFALIPEAGHLPQMDQPELLLSLVQEFIGSSSRTGVGAGEKD